MKCDNDPIREGYCNQQDRRICSFDFWAFGLICGAAGLAMGVALTLAFMDAYLCHGQSKQTLEFLRGGEIPTKGEAR